MPNVHFGTFVILCLTLLRSSCYQRVNSMASSGAAHMKKNHLAFSGIFWHRPPKPVWHFLASPKWPSGIFWHCQNSLLAFSGIGLEAAWQGLAKGKLRQIKASGIFWLFFFQDSCTTHKNISKMHSDIFWLFFTGVPPTLIR